MALKVVSHGVDQRPLQQRRRHRGVGGDEAEHRRQHRLDHPGALARAADVVDARRRLDADRVLLRERIGRHDRARRVGVRVRAQRLVGGDDPRRHRARIERHADDAGRGDQHLLGFAAEGARGLGRHQLGHLVPGVAGAGVGAAAVDDDGAGAAAGRGEVRLRHQHRRRGGQADRERAGGAGRLVGDEQHQVERAGARLDAAVDAGGAEAGRRGDAAGHDRDRRRQRRGFHQQVTKDGVARRQAPMVRP